MLSILEEYLVYNSPYLIHGVPPFSTTDHLGALFP